LVGKSASLSALDFSGFMYERKAVELNTHFQQQGLHSYCKLYQLSHKFARTLQALPQKSQLLPNHFLSFLRVQQPVAMSFLLFAQATETSALSGTESDQLAAVDRTLDSFKFAKSRLCNK
jgi:hypothetical protein